MANVQKPIHPKRKSLLQSLLGWGEAKKAGKTLSNRGSQIDRAVNQAVNGKSKRK